VKLLKDESLTDTKKGSIQSEMRTENPGDNSSIVNPRTQTESGLFKNFWSWLTATRERIFSIIFLLLFIALMLFLGFMQQDPTNGMLQIVFWFRNKTGNIGLYLGVGIISIFGNFVMFIPVLYAVVLMFVAVLDVNPFLLGIAAGIGASIGQIASWFVGRATKEVVDERLEKRLNKTQRWIERGFAPLLIFVFAATPLPDEVLLIMIGLIGYSLIKTLIYCFIGKIVLTLSVSLVANQLSQTAFGEWFLVTLFNVSREDLLNQTIPAASNPWTSIALWIITAVLLVLVTFFDWIEIADRFRCKRELKRLKLVFEYIDENEKRIKQDSNKRNHYSLGPIAVLAGNQLENLFPAESFWLLEEQIEEKKEVVIRKALLSLAAIAQQNVQCTISNKWLAVVRKKITDGELKVMKTGNGKIIQMPEEVLPQGFTSTNAQYISFSTKLQYLLPESNVREKKTKEFKKIRRLLRKKVDFEMIFEKREEEGNKIWALGLSEGLYLKQIDRVPKINVLLYWLHLLAALSLNINTKISQLKIIDLHLAISKNDDVTFPDLTTDCPI
jgi:membrane protein YqaA with SNARE-associated domain